MELPTFPVSFTPRKVVDKGPYKRNGEREWISQSEGLGQAFRRVSDRYADRIYVIQGEKELTPIARLSINVDQLANNTVRVICALLDALAADDSTTRPSCPLMSNIKGFSTTTTMW
jgi:hypothetical protein